MDRALGGHTCRKCIDQVSAGVWLLCMAWERVSKGMFCLFAEQVLIASLLGSGDNSAFREPLVERVTGTDGQVQLERPDLWRRVGHMTVLRVVGDLHCREGGSQVEAPRVWGGGGSVQGPRSPGWLRAAGTVVGNVKDESRGQVSGWFGPCEPLEVLGSPESSQEGVRRKLDIGPELQAGRRYVLEVSEFTGHLGREGGLPSLCSHVPL